MFRHINIPHRMVSSVLEFIAQPQLREGDAGEVHKKATRQVFELKCFAARS